MTRLPFIVASHPSLFRYVQTRFGHSDINIGPVIGAAHGQALCIQRIKTSQVGTPHALAFRKALAVQFADKVVIETTSFSSRAEGKLFGQYACCDGEGAEYRNRSIIVRSIKMVTDHVVCDTRGVRMCTSALLASTGKPDNLIANFEIDLFDEFLHHHLPCVEGVPH